MADQVGLHSLAKAFGRYGMIEKDTYREKIYEIFILR